MRVAAVWIEVVSEPAVGSVIPLHTTDSWNPDGSVLAPHVSVVCFARGLLKALRTRVYLAPEERAARSGGAPGSVGATRQFAQSGGSGKPRKTSANAQTVYTMAADGSSTWIQSAPAAASAFSSALTAGTRSQQSARRSLL